MLQELQIIELWHIRVLRDSNCEFCHATVCKSLYWGELCHAKLFKRFVYSSSNVRPTSYNTGAMLQDTCLTFSGPKIVRKLSCKRPPCYKLPPFATISGKTYKKSLAQLANWRKSMVIMGSCVDVYVCMSSVRSKPCQSEFVRFCLQGVFENVGLGRNL